MKFKQELITFENGLRLVFIKAPNFYTARMNVSFSVGSEDESDEFGMAHLLEHELFKGTSKYNQKELSEQFSRLASEPNASTSAQFTTYKARFPKPALERIVELFSDMVFDSVFDEKGLQAEKKVVEEEIKMHEDQPSHLAFDELIARRFGGTGLGNRIAGREELLRGITREKLVDFKNRHYNASNCIIQIAGDYELCEVKRLVEKWFSKKFDATKPENEIKKTFTSAVKTEKSIVKINKKIAQANIALGFSAPSHTSDDRARVYLINHILGGTMNSRLFDRIRNELSLCYGIYSTMINYANNGVLLVEFSTTNKQAKQATAEVLSIVEELKEKGVSDEEFEEAKYMAVSQLKMDSDYPTSSDLTYLACTGKLRDPDSFIKMIEGLTKSECLDCFRKFVSKDNMTVSFVGDTKQFDYEI